MKIRSKEIIEGAMYIDLEEDDGTYIGQLKTINEKFMRAVNDETLGPVELRFIEKKENKEGHYGNRTQKSSRTVSKNKGIQKKE